jgi:antitoxin (DNA-binding transcriptional repressor) of toxin-antitoxin stability system
MRYNDSMVTDVHDGKAQFESLVERASHGEEVLIAVDGKVKVRMTAAPETIAEAAPKPFDGARWWEEMSVLHRQFPATGRPMQEILDEMREDRF